MSSLTNYPILNWDLYKKKRGQVGAVVSRIYPDCYATGTPIHVARDPFL